ncbi:glycerophosphocholine cholinephosphodiesterase ENPP6-like [Haliotis rufescens]|uniref:glycerophosphocholine cholinephosphodiesterase ENPP6-like n=1 Tax=Haliotis rufescens TaxID=6454 RepID=UPI00201F72C3|nr:glycerophosphocholine cholinephosphodiesterase ENPP6-like [Haliotis rufescens]XP_046338931.2 glycerophosphocholine cholinephosphodiesterase ENPP6-like [Haliotis rufescens]
MSGGCFLSLLLLACLGQCTGEKVMLIVLGGFRWDYFNIHTYDVDGFSKVFEKGVKADHLIPSFPTLTYPNIYSLVTGLYPENHGVVGDEMWDPEMKRKFSKGDNPEYLKPYWWDMGEPVWVTAAKQGKTSYMFNWPGCDATIRSLQPTFCVPHSDVKPDLTPDLEKFMNSKREGLELLKNGSADFVGLYYEVTDYVTHLYSPGSQESKGLSRWLDNEFDKLIHDIDNDELEYDVNVLVASDHGVADISKKKVVNITAVLVPEDVDHIVGHGAIVSVWPKTDKVQQVYDKLKDYNDNVAVYLKDDIPDSWHYRDNIRVAPVTLVASLGWMIATPEQGLPKSDRGRRFRSYEGYDNKEVRMRATFFGFGPNLKRGYTLPAIENVNLYQLMCRILRITAAPNNGTWSNIEEAFIKVPYRPLITWKRTFTYGPVLAAVLVAAIIYYVKFRKHSDKHKEV